MGSTLEVGPSYSFYSSTGGVIHVLGVYTRYRRWIVGSFNLISPPRPLPFGDTGSTGSLGWILIGLNSRFSPVWECPADYHLLHFGCLHNYVKLVLVVSTLG